jgi:hypothetical protein
MANVRTIAIATVAEYALLSSEGKAKLEVIGNPSKPWVNERLAAAAPTYKHSYLVNFKAIEARKRESVLEAFDGEETMPLEDFKFNMVKEIIVHEGNAEPTLPISGEKVDCNIAYAVNKKEGGFALDRNGKKILEIRSMLIVAASVPQSFGSFAKSEETVTEATAEPVRQSVGAEEDADY